MSRSQTRNGFAWVVILMVCSLGLACACFDKAKLDPCAGKECSSVLRADKMGETPFYVTMFYAQPHACYTKFWEYIDMSRLDSDFERIKAMGFDGVVMWSLPVGLLWKEFDVAAFRTGAPDYYTVDQESYDRVERFFASAAAHGLYVDMLVTGGGASCEDFFENTSCPNEGINDCGGKAPNGKCHFPLYESPVSLSTKESWRLAADFQAYLARTIRTLPNAGYTWLDTEMLGSAAGGIDFTIIEPEIRKAYLVSIARAVKQANPASLVTLDNGHLFNHAPNGQVTRDRLATEAVIAYEEANGPLQNPAGSCTDVFCDLAGNPHCTYISKAFEAGWIGGTGQGTCPGGGIGDLYSPQQAANRAQAAVILVSAALGAEPPPCPPDPHFEDVPQGHWACQYVQYLWERGLAAGCSDDPPQFCWDSPFTNVQLVVLARSLFPEAFAVDDLSLVRAGSENLKWVPSPEDGFDYVGNSAYMGCGDNVNAGLCNLDPCDNGETPGIDCCSTEAFANICFSRFDLLDMDNNPGIGLFINEGGFKDTENDPVWLERGADFLESVLTTAIGRGIEGMGIWDFRDSYFDLHRVPSQNDYQKQTIYGLTFMDGRIKPTGQRVMNLLHAHGKTIFAGGEPNLLLGGGFEGAFPESRYVFVTSDDTVAWTMESVALVKDATRSYEGHAYALMEEQGSLGQATDLPDPSEGQYYELCFYAAADGSAPVRATAGIGFMDGMGEDLAGCEKRLFARAGEYLRFTAICTVPSGATRAEVYIGGSDGALRVDNVDLHQRNLTGVNRELGSDCSSGADCASGQCVNGVCCNSACDRGCEACSLALGAAADGFCSLLSVGTVCRSAADQCDLVETCDGVSPVCPQDEVIDPCNTGSDATIDPNGSGSGGSGCGCTVHPVKGTGSMIVFLLAALLSMALIRRYATR